MFGIDADNNYSVKVTRRWFLMGYLTWMVNVEDFHFNISLLRIVIDADTSSPWNRHGI